MVVASTEMAADDASSSASTVVVLASDTGDNGSTPAGNASHDNTCGSNSPLCASVMECTPIITAPRSPTSGFVSPPSFAGPVKIRGGDEERLEPY